MGSPHNNGQASDLKVLGLNQGYRVEGAIPAFPSSKTRAVLLICLLQSVQELCQQEGRNYIFLYYAICKTKVDNFLFGKKSDRCSFVNCSSRVH